MQNDPHLTLSPPSSPRAFVTSLPSTTELPSLPSDSSLLPPIALSLLLPSLSTPSTLSEISSNTGKTALSYVQNTLFKPVGYSKDTPHGMPQSIYENYSNSKSHIIINLPPKLLFDAGVFDPSKLCAVYEIEEEEGNEALVRAPVNLVEEENPLKDLGSTINDIVFEEEGEEDDFDFDAFMV
ncbi:hypothetical protein TL16_g08327 [Triparma laevis f. inornata]|uniref:Uncharacterized protein n=1 Tax=Triparma laevis f. inornata TaxID=1714386 RepID=A0A9W7AX43_9STRA|nr:hypothetical protein TL16_g08327 [Triparma laevis f. inornata]